MATRLINNPSAAATSSQLCENATSYLRQMGYADNVIGRLAQTLMKANMPYLLDKSTAKDFCGLVKDDLLKHSSYLMEVNPGFGHLTEQLLDSGIPKVYACEEREFFVRRLEPMIQKYGNDRIAVKHVNFYKFFGTVNWRTNKPNNDEMKKRLFEDLEPRPFYEPPAMQVIGCATTYKFFKHSIESLFYNTFGRCTYYMAFPMTMYKHLFLQSDKMPWYYKKKVVLFDLAFDRKVLGAIPARGYYPWPNTRAFSRIMTEDLHIVRYEPRVDVFSQSFTKENLLEFDKFLAQCIRNRKSRIIPVLEKAIPGFGVLLIERGHNIFTEVCDISSEEFYAIYQLLKKDPNTREALEFFCETKPLKPVEDEVLDLAQESIDAS